MKLHELMETLQREHAEELPRWYCDLNCFRVPQGFPLALPEIEDNRKKMEHPDYRLAWNAVTCALGEEGVSRAWWLVELGKTEGEWRTWWAARKGVIAA